MLGTKSPRSWCFFCYWMPKFWCFRRTKISKTAKNTIIKIMVGWKGGPGARVPPKYGTDLQYIVACVYQCLDTQCHSVFFKTDYFCMCSFYCIDCFVLFSFHLLHFISFSLSATISKWTLVKSWVELMLTGHPLKVINITLNGFCEEIVNVKNLGSGSSIPSHPILSEWSATFIALYRSGAFSWALKFTDESPCENC